MEPVVLNKDSAFAGEDMPSFGMGAGSNSGTVHFSNLLDQGPIEFFLGAEVSPSIRALRYSHNDEQMSYVDLALAAYYKYVVRKASPNERPHDMLHDVIDDATPKSMLWAEGHSLLAVYYADDGLLERAMYHFQRAVDAYQIRERDDALAVCFVRHSLSMSDYGYFRAAARSLLHADSFAANVERPVYRQVCQLARLQSMFLQGRVSQAAQGAFELQQAENLNPTLKKRLLALQYAGSVEARNEPAIEAFWQQLQQPNRASAPRGLIVARVRVRYLLMCGLFSEAAELALQVLQETPLSPLCTKRALLAELMSSEALSRIPKPLQQLFSRWIDSVDSEIQQVSGLDVNLNV